MQTIDYILGDYLNKNNNINVMKNNKLTLLINQISGDGSTITPKKIVGVSVIGGFSEEIKKEEDKKILESSEIMKQYLEDLKKNESGQKNHTPQRSHKIHKFYTESSVF
jgi:hypothetical protein